MNEMDNDNQERPIETLRRIVAAYGADPVRWPADQREAVATFVRDNPDAADILREAETLDRLLDTAVHAPDRAAPSQLVARIMSQATEPSTVVPFTPAANPRGPSQVENTPARRVIRTHYWPAAAMMAASLLVGIFIGGTGQLNSTAEQIRVYMGGIPTTELASFLPVGADDNIDQGGEDLL